MEDDLVRGKEEVREGSDSGVEVRAEGEVTPAVSCDSSLVSCCCSSEDLLSNTLQFVEDLSLSAGDGTSEGGSESSSLAGYHKPRVSVTNALRKKCPPVTSRPSQSRTEKTPTKTTPKSLHPSRALTPTTPRSHRDTSDSSTSRKTVSRVPSVSRKPTNSSPPDDGRWPSTLSKVQKPRPSVMTSSVTTVESKASALEKYATLPRRRRRSLDNLTQSEPVSSREHSLNRTASLRKKQNPMVSSVTTTSASPKSMPPYPRKVRMAKTRIYHEVSIQTALTGADLDSGLGRPLLRDIHSRVETKSCGIQVERGMRRIEQLESQLKECKAQLAGLAEEKEEVSKTCEQMRIHQLTRDAETMRLKALLMGKYDADDVVGQLEQQVMSTNSLITQQQAEISQLQGICINLQKELDKSYSAQRRLLKHHEEIEMESVELQEFLQAEKAALADTLRDLETELVQSRQALEMKEAELQRQHEECSHLVRMNEQRRQEQLLLEARLAGMELRSRESLLQQSAAVSGASVALSRLGARLDNLVDTLVTSYSISESDLEDVIFHNEMYSESSSADRSPEHQPSAAATLMTAVLNAIRTATSSKLTFTDPSCSDAEPMLSSEPEPSAFANRDITSSSSPQDIEKRLSIISLEQDVGKRHSIASIESPSKYSECEGEACGSRLENSESLHNLSLAIMRRQQLEAEDPTISLPPVPANTLLDQVIEVDNLVTRLLKVISIVQQTTDNSALQDKKRLSDSLTEAEAKMVSGEHLICQLKQEVQCLRDLLPNSNSNEVKERLQEKERQLGKACLSKQLISENWNEAMEEVRRQYQAIDSALEVLVSLQSVVKDNPALMQLQKDLEERNFDCAANLPLAPSPDLNANGPYVNGSA